MTTGNAPGKKRPQTLESRLGPFILIAAALGLAAVVAINALLFYGRLDGPQNPTFVPGRYNVGPGYSRPPYSLNPLPLEFERSGLTSGQIAEVYAQKRPLASGWSLTLFLSGGAFLASGVVVLKMAPNRPYDVLAVVGLMVVGVALLIAAVVSVTLLIETQKYHELFDAFSFTARSDARSAATLAMTTLNPLQQVLVFAFAPVGIALALAGLALSLPYSRRFRAIASLGGLLCAVLLFVGPLVAVFPNAVLRFLFAIGLGAAPLVLAAFGVSLLRQSAAASVPHTGGETTG